MKKVAQINITLKVSLKPFPKACRFPSRAIGLVNKPRPLVALRRGRNLRLSFKTEKGVRNATAFRGEANTTASPCRAVEITYPQKRSGGTFLTKQFLHWFVH
ncbi:hypothetical protein, partial [Huintestinicola sp.]|uniref:hypothetical protein n=1 Tax=Huintestinicola sp. TaxID=2981661 RepID=UPI003D7CC912